MSCLSLRLFRTFGAMNLSFGFIETQGLIASIEAADAMVKAAAVKLLRSQQIGSGLVTVVIEGELGAVQAAVEAARVAVARIGEPLIASWVIPNPFEDTSELVSNFLNGRLSKTAPLPVARPAVEDIRPEESVPDTSRKSILNIETKPPNDRRPEIPPADKTGRASSAARKKSTVKEWLTLPELLVRHSEGLTLNAISESLGQDAAEVRKALKKLMDSGLVEKVRSLFFLVKREDK